LNDRYLMQKKWPAAMTAEQRERLFGRIGQVFKDAIDARAPGKRPPGKAGLRAEKGYYRLLYLEDDFRRKADRHETAAADEPPCDWRYMNDILRQLTDIPELRSEIMAGVESALDELASV
jgi:hypothetical protein